MTKLTMTKQYSDLMVDIETLGTTPDALILSIGAVFFDRETRELGPTFHQHILPSTDRDGQIDADTVMWWMGQSDEARKALKVGQEKASPAGSVIYTLTCFTHQHCNPSKVNVWSLPAAFDLVLLDSLHRRHRMSTVWDHWQHRCLRTVVSEQRGVPVPRPKPSTAHDALADAVAQAHWLMEIDRAAGVYEVRAAQPKAPHVPPVITAMSHVRTHAIECGVREPELVFESYPDAQHFARSATDGLAIVPMLRPDEGAAWLNGVKLSVRPAAPKENTIERLNDRVEELRGERDFEHEKVIALAEQVSNLGDKFRAIQAIAAQVRTVTNKDAS